MSLRFRKVEARGQGLLLRLSVEVENLGPGAWRASDEIGFGCQIIDPEKSLYVEDGPRQMLDRDVAPGHSMCFELAWAPPPVDAAHRLYASAIAGGEWAYKKGWPMLVIDVRVVRGETVVEGWRVWTYAAWRMRLRLAALRRAAVEPWLALSRHRRLILSLVRRDLVARYRASTAGLFWALLYPLLLVGIYFFVFGVVLQTRFAGDSSRSGFVLYFLAGMTPWLGISEAVGRAPTVIVEQRNLVKKTVFPVETLPLSLVVAGLVTQLIAFGIFLVLLVAVRGVFPLEGFFRIWLWIVPQLFFTAGLCWLLAALGVFVRDLWQVNGALLTLWFFLTPICYPETSLSGPTLSLLSYNPLFWVVAAYRKLLLGPPAAMDWPGLLRFWLLASLVFTAGYVWFYSFRKKFADVL